MDIEKFISPLIESQFPSFYKEEGPNFIAFVKAYYEWLEQSGNPIYYSRRLTDFNDIDKTLDQFVNHFKNTYIDAIPSDIAANKRFLIKHILDLYRSKGTQKSYELLFRLLYNEDIELYYPGQHLFSSSEAIWAVPKYIEVSSSPYLPDLVGKKIYSQSASAILENYFIERVNSKITNTLYLSNLIGNFKFNEKIYCDDLYVNTSNNHKITSYDYTKLTTQQKTNYQLAINFNNAPVIFGSLSSITVTSGGSGYNIGDVVDVYGSGAKAKAKVLSTTERNGLVNFTLVDGGFGFSVNAAVTVTGGGGTGATFKIGGITNKQIYRINTDLISDYTSTVLDVASSGFKISVNNVVGTFNNGDTVTASANVVELDVTPFVEVNYGDVLSNSTYGIANLVVYRAEGSLIAVTGPESQLNNANLVPGVILYNGSSGSVRINTNFFKQTVNSAAIVTAANSSEISVNNANTTFGGTYYIPNTTLTNSNTSATANIVSVSRNTDWGFPNYPANSNLDEPDIGTALFFYDLEVGSIQYLSSINPGTGYSSNPTVEVVQPEIYNLSIPDGQGGYYGYNSVITADAGFANGIVTGLEVINSGLGYTPDEILTIYNANNQTSIFGTSIVDLNGIGDGYWENSKSFPSSRLYLQDSDFYQTFSYQIFAKKMLSVYENVVKDLVHPSGYKLFGGYINKNELTNESSELLLSEITANSFVKYTVDQTAVKADSNTVFSDRYTV